MVARTRLIVVYFPATPALDALHLVSGNTEGEEEFLMPVRGTALEFGVPAPARILIHSRVIQHLDPKVHVHDGRTFAGSHLTEHPGQQPLLVLETDDFLSRLAQACFEQPGSGPAA